MNVDHLHAQRADLAWLDRVSQLLTGPALDSAPRGMRVLEQLHRTIAVPIRQSLVTIPQRKLNYRFAAAEALWIIEGSNRLADLMAYNKRMAEFSDDGETLAGAYGPRLLRQREYVLAKLAEDPETRQAVASIWTPNPAPSKDTPCTIALTFMARSGQLHVHAFMRSSDVWLGVPYDLFSFACYALDLTMRLNQGARSDQKLVPGNLYLTAASSHLYETHREAAQAVLETRWVDQDVRHAPALLVDPWGPPAALHDALRSMRDHDAPWKAQP